jgi:uncharacterized protein (DUF1499 family)
MKRLWIVPSGVVVTMAALGPLIAHFEWGDPWVGFRIYFLGTLLAAVAAIGFAGAAAVATALGRDWRRSALVAALLPMVVTAIGLGSTAGSPRWPFHEVSTDLFDPPSFVVGPAAGLEFADVNAAAQRQVFPDLRPIRVPAAPAETLARVEEVARSMEGWEVVHVDPDRGLLQAVAVTPLFRFRDDVTIRVRPEGAGSRIDLRSRSRVGQSDLGANAARIEAFEERLLAPR